MHQRVEGMDTREVPRGTAIYPTNQARHESNGPAARFRWFPSYILVVRALGRAARWRPLLYESVLNHERRSHQMRPDGSDWPLHMRLRRQSSESLGSHLLPRAFDRRAG